MRHRHLDYDVGTPVTELGAAAIDDLLDRGTLRDWAPLIRELRENPWGELSEMVLRILAAHPMYGTDRLFGRLIGEFRAESMPGWPRDAGLVELRKLHGSTQADVGAALGMNQSEVSKLERRRDVRLSSLQAYVAATGGRLRLLVDYPDAPSIELVSRQPDLDGSEG